MVTSDHVPEVCLPRFPFSKYRSLPCISFSLNLFYPISRKWGTKSWFLQLLLPMFIFSGLWVILIHLISSIKKPTKSPSNSLQWICLLRIPRLPLEIDPKYLRDGEIGFVGYPRKKVEIRSFMIWINAWHSHCLEWRGKIHSWSLHLYFWSNTLNAFVFCHGPMTITLADIYMLTGLRIIGSM